MSEHPQARALARDIAARRAALDAEEAAKAAARLAGRGSKAHGRGYQFIVQDRREADGMAIALAYLLGKPGDRAAAEKLIQEVSGDG